MGVKDLWKLLEPTGRPVDLEQLRGLVLAVDVSMWLHQAVHGARDRAGQPLQSAHISLLFSRICKLLHYQIRPVFVFDGGTPALKQQTLAVRNRRRQSAGKKGQRAEEKQRSKYMQARILQQLTGEGSSEAPPPPQTSDQPDLFQLPPLPGDVFSRDKSPVTEPASEPQLMEDVATVDVASVEFASLPPELQHEILQERQEQERHSYTDPACLPPVANDFSNYQLSRLLKRSKLTKQLEGVRKTLRSGDTAASQIIGGQTGSNYEVEANRIMSSDSAHYILVKGVDLDESSSQDESSDVITTQDDVITNSDARPEKAKTSSDVILGENDVMPEPEQKSSVEKDVTYLISGRPRTEHSTPVVAGVDDESSSESSSEREEVCSTAVVCVTNEKEEVPSLSDNVKGGLKSPDPEPLTDTLSIKCRPPFAANDEESVVIKTPNTTAIDVGPNEPCSLSPFTSTAESEHLAPGVSTGRQLADDLVNTERELADDLAPGVNTERELADGLAPGVNTERELAEVASEPSRESERGGEIWDEGVLDLSPDEAQLRLRQEVTELGRESERQRRAAANVSSHVYREAQELLSLFGLPYIVSPMEAEAQCAHLDHTHQTDGSVTDDSDIFLFGGQKVYRHFFSQDHHPTLFHTQAINSILGLTRERMVCLAYLLGSDYTPGLDGVGVVNAMEVIGQFRGDGLDTLQKLKAWHSEMNSAPGLTLKSSLERKLRALDLPADFPSHTVWDAYMSPEVDKSTEQFEWGTPDLDLIRKFMLTHVGWNQDRVDSVIIPVLRRAADRERKITSYFHTSLPGGGSPAIGSKRLRNVVARITNRESSPDSSPQPKRGRQRTRGGAPDHRESSQKRATNSQRGRKTRVKRDTVTPANRLSATSSSSSDEE